MGASESSKQLNIATLNYSGILLSPFEFYTTTDDSTHQVNQLGEISTHFVNLFMKGVGGSSPNWQLGDIDKNQQKRYTPIYRKNAGLQNGKLLTQEEFSQKWKQQFEQITKQSGRQYSNEHKQQALKFDLHCYRSILYYLRQKYRHVANYDVKKDYQAFMENYFSKSFIDESKKLQKFESALKNQNIDVFFIQEASSSLMKELQTNKYSMYQVYKPVTKPEAQKKKQQQQKQKTKQNSKNNKNKSLILLKKQKFMQFHDAEKILGFLKDKQFVKGLNWNQDTILCMVDNFIFISTHLSSKQQTNATQIAQMVEDLDKLRKIYPMCEIVVGGDLNSYLCPQLVPIKYYCFPDDQSLITTSKKRTWLQPQVNKANVFSKQVKDSLLSTLPLINARVVTITGEDSQKFQFIPTQAHPCDHFVVTAQIALLI